MSSEPPADSSFYRLEFEAFLKGEEAHPEDNIGQAKQFLGKSTWMDTDRLKEGRKEGSCTVLFPHPVLAMPPQILPQFK